MKSRLLLFFLQVASWGVRQGRRQLEHRIGSGWDHVVSLQIDQLVTAEELLAESLTMEKAA